MIAESRRLTKAYMGKKAVKEVSIKICGGSIYGLLGPNGSGKTTWMKMMTGFVKPTQGEVIFDGAPWNYRAKNQVAYMSTEPFYYDFMNIGMVGKYYSDFFEDFDMSRANAMLESLKISPKDRLKTMSKGTKEKVQLILTMSRRAKLYCLDEPIAGVDPAARDYILSTILNNYEPDASILISTHLISDVENILDEVIFIQEGQLKLHASVEDIRMQEGESIDSYFREVFKC